MPVLSQVRRSSHVGLVPRGTQITDAVSRCRRGSKQGPGVTAMHAIETSIQPFFRRVFQSSIPYVSPFDDSAQTV